MEVIEVAWVSGARWQICRDRPVLAVRQLWNELGLDHVVAQGGGRGRGDGVERSKLWAENRVP